MNIKAVLEGILFIVGDEGISIEEIMNVLEISSEEVKNALVELKKDYESSDRGLRISFLGNAFKLTTKEEHKEYYEKLVADTRNTSLSNASLEVLAVIAYNEPLTRLQIDEIRGVNSSQIVRRLLARGFIKICGKAQSIGKPNLYKTTNDFLDYFGLASKDDLPEIISEDKINEDDKELYESNYKENN
ncbi:MAG: SMC-Scp complex subunit ScpB [Tenericutes bacterium]|nr:SMC-Scp complex subunit ScpB [Mycoplasmatota bacterium]